MGAQGDQVEHRFGDALEDRLQLHPAAAQALGRRQERGGDRRIAQRLVGDLFGLGQRAPQEHPAQVGLARLARRGGGRWSRRRRPPELDGGQGRRAHRRRGQRRHHRRRAPGQAAADDHRLDRIAEQELIAVLQRDLEAARRVDEHQRPVAPQQARAVGRAQVLVDIGLALAEDLAVLAGQVGVGQAEEVLRRPADGQARLADLAARPALGARHDLQRDHRRPRRGSAPGTAETMLSSAAISGRFALLDRRPAR